MAIHNVPRVLWVGLALIVVSSLAHLGLEVYRGVAVVPQLQRGPELVTHTYEVITAAQNLDRALQDAERGQRGFLITGDEAYLRPYDDGIKRAPELVARLKQLTVDNPEQQRRMPVLENQVNIKLAELKRTLDVRQTKGIEAARQIVLTNLGLEAMEALGKVIDATIATERALLLERLARAAEYE